MTRQRRRWRATLVGIGLAAAAALAPGGVEGQGGTPEAPEARIAEGSAPASGSVQASFETVTSDGVTVYGEIYDAGLGAASPLVLLFHQGGSSGRGEYAPIAAWLNGLGMRAVAVDLRSGGDLHGAPNRTAVGLEPGTPDGFCDAYPDLQAALDYVVSEGLADRPIVWGSSYSGALVFRLAAENPSRVAGVLAFSPASGGPMVDCRARAWASDVTVPRAAFRPDSEMARPPAQEQRQLLEAAGVEFTVVPDGVHGSSMLVDERTGSDMTETRDAVRRWLEAVGTGAPAD